MSLSDQIRSLIETTGVEEFAKEFDVSVSTAKNYLSGKSHPSFDVVSRIYDKLNKESQEPQGPVKKEVILLVPAYKDSNPRTWLSLWGLKSRWGAKLGLDLQFKTEVTKARNRLLTRFRHHGDQPEWALFIDDDMFFPFGNAFSYRNIFGFQNCPASASGVEGLSQLISRGKPLIGGLYFGRNRHQAPMYYEGINATPEMRAAIAKQRWHDKIVETKGIGFGATLINRSVLEAMEDKYPEIVRDVPHTRIDDNNRPNRYCEPDADQGEDMAFCFRAASCGIPTYVDYRVVCGHLGYKVYHGE
jgi:transcriptional regulator with XRE-family HTH domain